MVYQLVFVEEGTFRVSSETLIIIIIFVFLAEKNLPKMSIEKHIVENGSNILDPIYLIWVYHLFTFIDRKMFNDVLVNFGSKCLQLYNYRGTS